MKSRDAKIENFSRARWWTLVTGIALMLVASPQAWAGIADAFVSFSLSRTAGILGKRGENAVASILHFL